MKFTSEELGTILAALRFYQQHDQGNPYARKDDIHAIATNNDDHTSLDAEGIDDLCMRLNSAGNIKGGA